ncbi:PAS domain-containing sensor histidine kinase [Chryseolinea sp. T2]|uniref:PAS domain-containing sensor histidine kinase n=1 Tax=Chryseolinea sp. T2 TaxID=3129255 RepID=UPI0030770B4E
MFRELVENSEDIIIVTDSDFNIRYISSSVSTVFGFDPPSVVGKNIFEYIEQDKIAPWRDLLRQVTSSCSDEFSVYVGGQKRYFDVHVANLLDSDSVQGVVLKLHDITDKKLRERELKRSNEHLDQVIYKTTHDLKAPLTSALGLIQIAERARDEEKDQYIRLIKKSLQGLDAYIEEMNNFFRNEKLALQRERIDFRDMLQQVQESLINVASTTNIDVLVNHDESLPWYSDSIRVKTIVNNIFSNAIKYQDLQKQNPFIKIATRITPEFCEISIADNGIGIEEEFQDRIFDLFFRATDQANGTGLGLFIVRDTIQRLNGSITVDSVVGKGTTFFIRIPNQLHQNVAVA